MFSVPPPTVRSWFWRTTVHALPSAVPSKLSTIPPPPPPPPVVPSGLKRIQSNRATGYEGAWSDSATGPICGFWNVASEPGRPTGRKSTPLKE